MSKENQRFPLRLEAKLKKDLEIEAQKENRSLNNLINVILKNYIENKKINK